VTFAEELLRRCLASAIAAHDEEKVELLKGMLRRYEVVETESIQTTVIHGPEDEIEKLQQKIADARRAIGVAHEKIAAREAEIRGAEAEIARLVLLLNRRRMEHERLQSSKPADPVIITQCRRAFR
jgi:hypothetical protein